MNRLPEFQTEMTHNLNTYRWSHIFYKYSRERSFKWAMYSTYLLGLLINLTCIIGYGYDDPV